MFSPSTLAVWLLSVLYGSATLAHAQPVVPPPAGGRVRLDNLPAAPPTATPSPVNGYAENIRPTQPRVRAAGAGRPYEPIRKTDDEGQVPEIEMFVGESRVFPSPGVARIAVGNGALLTAAALDNKEVILFANGAGTSSLFIWNADGRYQRVKISIVPGDTTRNARDIAAFLSTIPKARASIVGVNIIVEGDDLADADLSKVDDLAKRYPQIVNFTNRVGWEQMVQMDVKVVEFPLSFLRDVGLRWNATGGAAVGAIWGPARRGDAGPYQISIQTGADNVPPITAVDGFPLLIPRGLNVLSYLNLGLNAQLNLLEQEGKATTLAEPQLSARNGSKASFTAGGEIPYAVQTRDGISVAFKEYGVKLDITPRVDHRGVIRATIRAEVSSIDASLSTPGGPALLTRKTDTEFNLRSGETMVLAGLLQRDVNTTIDKVPLLGDLPVLGALFRSKRFQNRESEMVVFVTPTVVNANSAGNVDRIGRTTERLQERMGPDPYLSDPLQPGVRYERPNVVPPRAPPPTEGTGPSSMTEIAPISALPLVPSQTAGAGPVDSTRLARTAQGFGGATLRIARDVPLRIGPGDGTAPLLQLERGAVVRLGAADDRAVGATAWRNVVVGALDGWIPATAVTVVAGPTGPMVGNLGTTDRLVQRPLAEAPERALPKPLTLDPPGAQARMYRVARDGLVLRITPDVNGEVLYRPLSGDTALALPHPPRGSWTAVQLGTGETARRGWMASQWLLPVAP